MEDLVAPDGFKFNTSNQVSINLTSVNLQGNTVPNATFGIYKDDLADSTLVGSFRKTLTASTNEIGVYESTIPLPTSLDSIWIQSGVGFVRSFPIEVVGNGEAEVVGEFPYLHHNSKNKQKLGRNNLDDFPFMTMGFVKHHDEELHYFYLAGENQGEYNEGHINLTSKPSDMDVKAFTIGDDGVMYFYNKKDKYLYKILPSEIDQDPNTDVDALPIGEMDGLDHGDSELNSLQFINGQLYGFGKKDFKLYEINHTNAGFSVDTTITFPPKPDPEITGLTQMVSTGEVYFIMKKGIGRGEDSELWNLNMNGFSVTKILTFNDNYYSGSGHKSTDKLESLAAHPNGKLYVADDHKYWWCVNLTTPSFSKIRKEKHIHFKDWDFYYEGEIEGPTDTDGDGVDDEEDAYPNNPNRAFQSFTPSETEFATLMFEDLWPATGDYDMNDLVLDYQICEITNASDDIVADSINFKLRASGASYTLGFAIKFPDTYTLSAPSDPTFNLATLETGDENVIRFFNDQRTIFDLSGSSWINTDPNAGDNVDQVEWNVTIPISESKASPRMISPWYFPPYNPFIFVNNTRSHEIHLLDYPPTSEMNTSLLDTESDASNPAEEKYFRTSNGLPWAVNVTEATVYPLETYEITYAFLHFADWVTSGGSDYPDWYSNSDSGYRDNNFIYFAPEQ